MLKCWASQSPQSKNWICKLFWQWFWQKVVSGRTTILLEEASLSFFLHNHPVILLLFLFYSSFTPAPIGTTASTWRKWAELLSEKVLREFFSFWLFMQKIFGLFFTDIFSIGRKKFFFFYLVLKEKTFSLISPTVPLIPSTFPITMLTVSSTDS